MLTVERWENKRRGLRRKVARLMGLRKLSESFAARRAEFDEVDDPTVRQCQTLWPEFQRRRVPPERRTGTSFTTERVSFPGVEGEPDIVGVLRTPKDLGERATALLCLHGHARGLILGKEITECYSVPLAEKGIITFAPDALRFGGRRKKEYDAMEVQAGGQTLFLGERTLAFNLLLTGKTLLGEQMAEFMRCIDFLEGIPNVGRIAVMGHSMGGIYAFWLAALDERVDAAVCLAGLLSYKAMVERNVSRYHGINYIVPSLLKTCDTPDIVSLIAPRSFHAVHAEKDLGFPIDEVRNIVSAASEIYKLYGADRNLVSKVLPGDHGDLFTEETVADIAAFLKTPLPQSRPQASGRSRHSEHRR